MDTKKNYIAGKWRKSISEETSEVINPSNGKVIAKIYEGDEKDAREAIGAAKRSFYEDGEWRRMDVEKRADIIFDIADRIEGEQEEFTLIDPMNNGKPLREAENDVGDAVQCFRYYAGLITKPYGGVYDVNSNSGTMHSYTVHEPVGVCAQITPWNYPLLMATWKIAPALAAGNSIVFKPASLTPLSAVKLFEIIDEIGLPKGTANLVMGKGSTVGRELAQNSDVDMITFTGSTKVGQGIYRAASSNLKKIGLELGGKSPLIIFSSVDIDQAVEWSMLGVFFNQGEVCSATSRILVERSIHDEFVEKFVSATESMTIGDPMENPDIGPIISEEQMNKVLSYIELGKKENAKCLCGGYRYIENECRKGYFIKPTIFDNCSPEMRIVKEEIFGPVVTIQTFSSEDEAVCMANDTEYGLAGAVFSRDNSQALRVIKEVRAGITWVNCSQPTYNEAPWGGYKMSGIGRELGVSGLEEYQETKQININISNGRPCWYNN